MHVFICGKYDAAVGDLSIVAKRSKYVDFTLPYAESNVRMLIRAEDGRHLNMWIFLRPFGWDLWLSIAIASAFIGTSIQFMERKTDNDAESEGSPRREQLKGMSIIWLPLAQVVLPQSNFNLSPNLGLIIFFVSLDPMKLNLGCFLLIFVFFRLKTKQVALKH